MTFTVQLVSGVATDIASDALIVAVFAGGVADSDALGALEPALGGGLLAHLKASEFEGKLEQLQEVPTFGRVKARRLLVIGLGPKADADGARVRSALAAAVRSAQSSTTKTLAIVLAGKASAEQKKQLEQGVAVGHAVNIARDAVNEPPNELYPETLAQVAQRIAKENGFKIKVLDKKGIAAAGMHLHYAVGQGSANEPRFIHLSYVPKKKKKKVVFVGKGLTFDSGGLCIKPAAGMGEMKSDMAGAAAVLGLMAAVGVTKPDIELHVLVGAAENMPDAAAYRPADVFGSLDGKTVEIVNTDAEGRLVLADALAYAVNLKPDVIVDAATLTGAALVALGKSCSAFYATTDDLAATLEASAREAGEQFWRMPLLEDLAEQLKSDIADLKHTGDRYGGSITAALFLREFVGKVPWIHCDIAGPVLSDRAKGMLPKGGTGHAVLTFMHLIEGLAR